MAGEGAGGKMTERPLFHCARCNRPFRALRSAKRRFCRHDCYVKAKTSPFINRFWSKVDKRGPDECWPWMGTLDKCGYGQIGSGGKYGKKLKAHRIAFEAAYGPIPAGLSVCHTCDNPLCVNPAHLFLGTQADNMADMTAKGRRARRAQHGRPGAKLFPADVLTIRKSPATLTALAECYGVGVLQIKKIRARTAWAWLEDSGT